MGGSVTSWWTLWAWYWQYWFMLATWSYGTGGIEESAICSWQVPRPGEKRYVTLPAEDGDTQ